MSEIVMGIIAGLKLSVYAALTLFVYMTQHSNSKLDFSKIYYLAAAFGLMATVEYIYVLSLAQGSLPVLSFLSDFGNVKIVMDVLYTVAALSIIAFLRSSDSSVE